MDKLKLDRASLSGDSLGGWVAAHFAVVQGPARMADASSATAAGALPARACRAATARSSRAPPTAT